MSRQSGFLRVYMANWQPPQANVAAGPPRLRMPLGDGNTTADFELIREFLYTGQCRIASNKVFEVLVLADYFQVTSGADRIPRPVCF